MNSFYTHIKKNAGCMLAILAGLFMTAHEGKAQLNPFGSVYFQNQYLVNPSMAAVQNGITINAGYRQQWSYIPNSPRAQYATGEYRLNDKVGLGVTITNVDAGLIMDTKFMATYAYHLVFDEGRNRTLHMGLSLGAQRQHLDEDKLSGDAGDPVVAGYNNRSLYVDGDFGVAFTEKKLTVQAVLPNSRMFFENMDEDSNRPTFFTAISYKLTMGKVNTVGVEPKVCYRGVSNYKNLVDVGANFTFKEDMVNFFLMYHSSKNATIGAGMDITERFRFTAMYLSGTSEVGTYSKSNFELGLKVFLGDKE